MFKVDENSILDAPCDETLDKEANFYRVRFPKEYVSFIKKYNGCIPLTNTFKANDNEFILERFICILGDKRDLCEQGWYDMGVVIEPIYEFLTDNGDELGITLVPIGILFAGDLLCLDFRTNSNEPEICIWYHEESEEFEPVTKKIADNFGQFIDMLE